MTAAGRRKPVYALEINTLRKYTPPTKRIVRAQSGGLHVYYMGAA